MAKAEIKVSGDFALKLDKLSGNTDEIAKKALEAGGQIVLDRARSNLQAVIGAGTKYPSRSTGELLSALGLSPPRVSNDGNYDIKIGFRDPRRRTQAKDNRPVTNSLVGSILEHGKVKADQKPTNYLSSAKKSSKDASVAEMKKVLQEEIDKLNS